MPDGLTLLCERCASIQRVVLADLQRVPLWLSILMEAFQDAGVGAIRVQTCDICTEVSRPVSAEIVLADLKKRLEGPLDAEAPWGGLDGGLRGG